MSDGPRDDASISEYIGATTSVCVGWTHLSDSTITHDDTLDGLHTERDSTTAVYSSTENADEREK